MTLRKYPRTRHIQGSKLQPGDDDLAQVPITDLAGAHVVVEEKVDGANAGLSFTREGELRLQSRGHFLTGGRRERHFALLKTWAQVHRGALHEVLGHRFVLYGEWLYAKHTIYYDRLPHYLLEFDVLDRDADAFLSTRARRALLDGLPIASVPVVHEGAVRSVEQLREAIRPSLYKGPAWRERLRDQAAGQGLDADRVVAETDPSDLAEGLYLKHEDADHVLGRYKLIRPSFLTAVVESETHWLDRPIVPNQLADGVDLYA